MIGRSLLVLSILISSASCEGEIEYLAKYCVGEDGYFYVLNDLTTYEGHGSRMAGKDIYSNLKKGKIIRKEHDLYVEYSGDLNFVALKSFEDAPKIGEFQFEFMKNYYVVTSKNDRQNQESYFIDNDRGLFKIEEKIVIPNSDDLVIRSELCGGNLFIFPSKDE